MNGLFCWLLLLSAVVQCRAQNLIPNGGFESYTGCPTNYSQIDSTLFWLNPSTGWGSPDYFNQCALPVVSVPNNQLGYQPAHSGVAYGGIYITQLNNNVREYLEVPLTTPLTAKTCYHFEMYVNLIDQAKYTSDAIGVYFSDTAILNIGNFNPLPVSPQISNPTANYFDTVSWKLVSGDYTAKGDEKFLIIGNFKDDALTDLTIMNNSGTAFSVYTYIDDVSLTATDPCITGINEFDRNSAISIYPNPFHSTALVQINPDLGEGALNLYNAFGSLVNTLTVLDRTAITLQRENLSNGLYFLHFINGNGHISTAKLVLD